jgi:hypothetical protein
MKMTAFRTSDVNLGHLGEDLSILSVCPEEESVI